MLPYYQNQKSSEANPDVKVAHVQYVENVGAEYGEHIKNTGAICNTSASHTYGNVLAIIEQSLLSKFPKELFKTVTASTTLASRQVTHLPSQLHKKERPIMVLHPRIVFGQGEDRFLAHTLINDRVTNTHSFWGDGSLLMVAKDTKKRLYVHGHYNRAVMFVDVVLSFDTFTEQTNWLSYLYNTMPIGHNQFIQAPLELMIPYNFCHLIGSVAHIPVKDDEGSIVDFLQYMNKIWFYPITYKLKGSSNTDEFFMYYVTNIDTVIQDVQSGDGVKMGQTRGAFDISFTIRCEFNTVGYFTLNAPDIKVPVNVSIEDDKAIATMFSDTINLNDFDLPIGWVILGWPIFKLKYGENSVSLDSLLNQSLRAVIDYHIKFGIPMERFIRIQFRENGTILEDEAFYIDWRARKLIVTKPDYRRTYRLIITVSPKYINDLVKEIYHLE